MNRSALHLAVTARRQHARRAPLVQHDSDDKAEVSAPSPDVIQLRLLQPLHPGGRSNTIIAGYRLIPCNLETRDTCEWSSEMGGKRTKCELHTHERYNGVYIDIAKTPSRNKKVHVITFSGPLSSYNIWTASDIHKKRHTVLQRLLHCSQPPRVWRSFLLLAHHSQGTTGNAIIHISRKRKKKKGPRTHYWHRSV